VVHPLDSHLFDTKKPDGGRGARVGRDLKPVLVADRSVNARPRKKGAAWRVRRALLQVRVCAP
jgi:hypothetical protein